MKGAGMGLASDWVSALDGVGAERPAWRRPQSLALCFAGAFMYRRPGWFVNSGDLVRVLGQAGVAERAARTTVARMVERGLLVRERAGRRTYVGLTAHGRSILREGDGRIQRGPIVSRDGIIGRRWDGRWTLLGFSLPEARRAERHLLRSRLVWEGFGCLQDGLWIAAEEADLDELTRGLDLDGHLRVFRSQLVEPADPARMIAQVWDLASVAERYEQFVQRWEGAERSTEGREVLPRHLAMLSDWLDAVRGDPHVPLEYLPGDWPGVRAQQVFSRVRAAFAPRARTLAEEQLDWQPFEEKATGQGSVQHGP